VLVVMARTGGAARAASRHLLVPADAGRRYGRKEDKMGWNSQPTRAIASTTCACRPTHLLGEEGDGFRIAMKGLDGGRINIAACSVGAAQGRSAAARRYMGERKQFGRARRVPGAAVQAGRHGDRARRRAADGAAGGAKLDAGSPDANVYCAMAKRFATDVGFQVCNDALQIHGGYGYIREYPLERWLRDVRVHQILEGTNEIMRVIVARHAAGRRNGDHSMTPPTYTPDSSWNARPHGRRHAGQPARAHLDRGDSLAGLRARRDLDADREISRW
jgi:alkylation response protein AidB-like acyl-CoA dehydrogenase